MFSLKQPFQPYMKVTAKSYLYFFYSAVALKASPINRLNNDNNKKKRNHFPHIRLQRCRSIFIPINFNGFDLASLGSHEMESVNISPPVAHKHTSQPPYIHQNIYRNFPVWLLFLEFTMAPVVKWEKASRDEICGDGRPMRCVFTIAIAATTKRYTERGKEIYTSFHISSFVRIYVWWYASWWRTGGGPIAGTSSCRICVINSRFKTQSLSMESPSLLLLCDRFMLCVRVGEKEVFFLIDRDDVCRQVSVGFFEVTEISRDTTKYVNS